MPVALSSRPAAGPAPAVAPRRPRRQRDQTLTADDRAALRRSLRLAQCVIRGVFERHAPDVLRSTAIELVGELRGLRDRLDPPLASGRGARP